MSRRAKSAFWVTLALIAGYLVLPDSAGATTITTTMTCSSTMVCGSPLTTPTPAASAAVSIVFVGGTTSNMLFQVTPSGGAQITNLVANLNTGGTRAAIGGSDSLGNGTTQVNPVYDGLNNTSVYISSLVVTWNDNAVTTTTTTTTTPPTTQPGDTTTTSSTTTSTSTTSTSTSTSTTTSTTTPTTLPRGPGNGPIAPRPEGNLAAGTGVDATAVRGNERVDVVVSRGSTPSIQQAFWNGSTWSNWNDLGAPSGGYKNDPTIISWAPGRLDVFARGGDDKLWQRFSLDGGTSWSDWIKPVGDNGTLASPPDASTRGPNTLDLWAVGTDGNVYQLWWDGVQWNGWLSQSRPTTVGIFGGSHPTATSRDGTRVDIFVRGADSKLWQKSWTGFDWTGWVQPVGNDGTLDSSPDAASWDASNLVVFIIGTDRHMYALPFGTGGWGTWNRLADSASNFLDSPGAASRGLGRFDAFGRGTDSVMYQIWQ